MRFGCHDAENESMLNKGYPNEKMKKKKNMFWVVVGGAYTYICTGHNISKTYIVYSLQGMKLRQLSEIHHEAFLSVAELKWFALRYLHFHGLLQCQCWDSWGWNPTQLCRHEFPYIQGGIYLSLSSLEGIKTWLFRFSANNLFRKTKNIGLTLNRYRYPCAILNRSHLEMSSQILQL